MATTMSDNPKSITGGCLCSSVRYEATISPKHDLDDSVGTCQCVNCRKSTGSLFFHFHQFHAEDVVFTSQEGLKTYQATPGKNRAFCRECGSFLFFKSEGSKFISLAVGCFDAEPLKEYGPILTRIGANLWCKNEIEGVTDGLPGEKFDTEPGPEPEGKTVVDEKNL